MVTNARQIMRLNPTAHETGRHMQYHTALLRAGNFKQFEPAIESRLAKFGTQARAHFMPLGVQRFHRFIFRVFLIIREICTIGKLIFIGFTGCVRHYRSLSRTLLKKDAR